MPNNPTITTGCAPLWAATLGIVGTLMLSTPTIFLFDEQKWYISAALEVYGAFFIGCSFLPLCFYALAVIQDIRHQKYR
jgi:predicted membrane protein